MTQPLDEVLVDYSPPLHAAMDEVLAVLRRHQVGGCVILASSTHTEFRMEFPAWSTIQPEGEHGLRVKAKGEDNARMEASLHVLLSVRDMLAMMFAQVDPRCQKVVDIMRAHGCEVTHVPPWEREDSEVPQ